jgi:hypothetical protein
MYGNNIDFKFQIADFKLKNPKSQI